jgi:hypothetical protein
MKNRRAIGVVRVSEINGREGESFASPRSHQRASASPGRPLGQPQDALFQSIDWPGGSDVAAYAYPPCRLWRASHT